MATIIANKMPQTVTVSILNEDGHAVARRIGPHATLGPIEDGQITSHVRRLVEQNHLRLRRA